jgi:hypothetical protein
MISNENHVELADTGLKWLVILRHYEILIIEQYTRRRKNAVGYSQQGAKKCSHVTDIKMYDEH